MSFLELLALPLLAGAGETAVTAATTAGALTAVAPLAEIAPAAMSLAQMATIGSGILGAGGALVSGLGQSQMAKYNAEVARQAAAAARKAGEFEYTRREEAGSVLLGKQRALYGASGVESEGSPLLVMAETAGKVERDAMAAKYNYQVQAAQDESQASLMEMYGGNAMWNALFKGGASLLQIPWALGQSPLMPMRG